MHLGRFSVMHVTPLTPNSPFWGSPGTPLKWKKWVPLSVLGTFMRAKLITNFNRLNEADYQALVRLIIGSLMANARFPRPWPAPAPSLEQIIAAFEAYLAAYQAALTGDSVHIAERNAARVVLTGLLQHLAAYLEFVAHNDEVALQSTGFELRHDTVKVNRNAPLPPPEGLQVKHGAFSGTLDLRVNRLAGAGTYDVQYALGDPTVEANWRHAMTSTSCSHMVLSELTPLQTYSIRVRGVIGQDYGLWCAPVSIVVL
jgi:hypothetical protein